MNEQFIIYKLTLCDGNAWGFSAEETIRPWLERLKGIMRLKEAREEEVDFRITFLAFKSDGANPDMDLTGWKNYKRGEYFRLWKHDEKPEYFVELKESFLGNLSSSIVDMNLSLRPIYRYYSNCGGSPVHTALAEFCGKGIMLCGRSGAGKSTCSGRLPSHWASLCDDAALIIRQKETYRIHPMPTWSDHIFKRKDSSFNCSYSTPLKAIFFIDHGDKDEIIQIKKVESVQRLYESFKQGWISFNRFEDADSRLDLANKLFDTACSIVSKIPSYKLKVALNGKFWEEIERVII